MLYHLLKATEGRRLFTAKNLPKDKTIKDALKEIKINDIENANRIDAFHYNKESANWISPETGELFVTEEDFEEYEKEMAEKET